MSGPAKKPQTSRIVFTIVGVTLLFVFLAFTFKEARKKPVAKAIHTPLPEETVAATGSTPENSEVQSPEK